MKRRRLVALVAASVLGLMGIVAVSAILFVTRTDAGREWLREMIRPFVARRLGGGNVYIGHLSTNLITEVTIDSIAIRDKHSNELFLSTGRVTVGFDPRDIIDNRIYIRHAQVEHPFVHLVEHENGVWNFREIFASAAPTPPQPQAAKRRGFGDFVVVDSAQVRDAQFLLTLPWHPDDNLKGAARDSAIRVHLENPERAVTRRADGYGRTYAWRNMRGLIAHARLADPDSDKMFGQQFVVSSLSVDEYEPTFRFRNFSGSVTHRGDSAWFQVSHFEMPGSVGRGNGKVWWGSDLPLRYDIAIRGDSVALDDVNWVYPTLPRTGGGSLDLQIKNDPKNPQIVDFKLVKMDVTSTGSHLTGDMSFGIGAPVLLVRNVDLRADPVDFDLLRTLAGKPFPEDWQGQLFGTVRGRGGPLTNFVVDDARLTFRDKHVRGAESRLSGKGELDILNPAFTVFHGFDVNAASVDLRTIEFLFPSFPRLGGFVSGRATLDSSWLDVRFSDADVTHQDGPGEPSRITGSGRITYGDLMAYDVDLNAEPASLTMLARSYPGLPLRGPVSGPVRAKGTAADLAVVTSLQGPAGALTFDGRLDIDSAGGYGVHGRGQFSAVNVASLLESPAIPAGTLSGHYDVDAAGETAASTTGTAEIGLEPTVFDGVRVYPSQARLRFADGKMYVDSLRVHTIAATLTAAGAIGLPKGSPDTVSFHVSVDSLGGLRRYLASADSVDFDGAPVVDSLSGSASLTGRLFGTLDAPGLSGRLEGENLYINRDRGEKLTAAFDLRDLVGGPSGLIEGALHTVTLAGIAIDTIGGRLELSDGYHSRFTAGVASHTGPSAVAGGVWNRAIGGVADSVLVDSLRLAIGNDHWDLDGPARFTRDSAGFAIDTLLLRNSDSALVAFTAKVPVAGAAFARLRASRLSLREIGLAVQLSDSVSGTADVSLTATGSKLQPEITANARLTGVRLRSVDMDSVTSTARYAAGRVNANLLVMRGGKSAITADASVPATVTLFGVRQRDDTISGTVRADTTDLSILKALLPGADSGMKVSGHLTANMSLSGTWRNKVLRGGAAIADGAVYVPQLRVTVSRINGSVEGSGNAGQDSIGVNLRAVGDGRPAAGEVRVTGYVKNLLQSSRAQVFGLQLSASNFHVFNQRTLADLYVSTVDSASRRQNPLSLTGTSLAPELSGSIFVDRGSIFLADRDIARKRAVEFISDSVVVADSAARSRSRIRSPMLTSLVTNLRTRNVSVALGDNVRLRSAEANVKLGGSLQLLTSSQPSRSAASAGPLFQLEGVLSTQSGSYNLNLGLVQREFQVQPGGTVTFDGPVDNPLLDIRALYNVRRPGDRDLGVIVNLHDRLLPYPVIDLSSTSDYEIAPSDLISYLITGKPGFDYGANAQTSQVIASFLAPTISAVMADKLRQNFGSRLDFLQFQLGTSDAATATGGAGFFDSSNLRQYLSRATIGAGWQLGNFGLNVNTGFCQQPGQGFNPRDLVGAKVEYRFDPRLSTKLAYDPPTAGRLCEPGQTFTGFVQTPGQFSASLLHTWRF